MNTTESPTHDRSRAASNTRPDGPSVEAEASDMMSRGRGRPLVVLAVGAVGAAIVAALVLNAIGEADVSAQAATEVSQIRKEHFEGFLSCALPGTGESRQGAQQIRVALQQLGNNLGTSYASTLRRCEPRVRALKATVDALRVPEAAASQHAALVASANALVTANARYLDHLSSADSDYEHGAALPMQEAFAVASSEFARAQQDLKRALE